MARLAESGLCAKLGAFVLLFHSKNTLIRTRECLFRELMGSNRWRLGLRAIKYTQQSFPNLNTASVINPKKKIKKHVYNVCVSLLMPV